MAGLYIRNVKLPESAFDTLYLAVHRDGTVEYDGGPYGWQTTTATPVQDHGKLIDADALPLGENVPTVMMHDGERWISAYELAMAPIVIPAEPPKEEVEA